MTNVYDFDTSVCRPTALISINLFGFSRNSCMLLRLTIGYSLLNASCVKFTVRLQGNTKELHFVTWGGGKLFAVHFNDFRLNITQLICTDYRDAQQHVFYSILWAQHLAFIYKETENNFISVLSVIDNCWKRIFSCGIRL